MQTDIGKFRDQLFSEEIRQEQKNIDDELFINLTRFLGSFIILLGVGVLIASDFILSKAVILLAVLGFSIIIGVGLWAADDEKTLEKIRVLKEKKAIEENTGDRVDVFSQNN